MYKHLGFAAAAFATLAVASPAMAAVTITPNPDPCSGVTCSFEIAGTTFGDGVGSFTHSDTFTLPTMGVTGGTIGNFRVSVATDIDFSRVFLVDSALNEFDFDITNLEPESEASILLNTFGGTYTLVLEGTSGGNASYGGNLSFAAVPEPGTWAMFILGFGVLGFGMRRRNAQVTSAKATLNFA